MDITLSYMPTKKQAMFHASTAYEVLYGGAAGGGKSKAIVMEAIIDSLENKGVHSYLFRKTYPELKATLIKEALSSIKAPIAVYSSASHDLIFSNGSVMHFRYCRNITDAYRYQGMEMHRLYIDELTHFPLEVYEYLKTRVRAPKALNVAPKIRLTSNPGGVGHGWVKALFIDSGPPFEIRNITVKSSVLNKHMVTNRQYIPAYATDNPHLCEQYILELEQKPEALRKALLLGDWNVFEGQVFTEFTDDRHHYMDRRNTHVIAPFKIPADWKRFRSFDWGYSRPFSVGYWAMDNDGRLYRYAEIYGSYKDVATGETKSPNKGLRLEPSGVAELLKNYEERYENGNKIIGIADPSIFDESRGSDGCIAKLFERCGIYFERGDNERIAGKLQIHYRLRFDENGIPMMYVFNTCKDFIRTIKSLVYDVYNIEDIDTSSEDHIYDETRYMCMYSPVFCKAEISSGGAQDYDDPLDLFFRQQPIRSYSYNYFGGA